MTKNQLLSAKNIKVTFGEQTVLDIDNLYVYEGEKIGLVGVNGAGKTTLLRILAGEIEPDEGIIDCRCEPFFFHQFEDEIEYEELSGREVKNLGVKDVMWQQNVSGGESTRLRLAQVFSSDRPLVFLDEPTANLDMDGINVLKNKLKNIDSMVLISHDRALLNEVCTRIIELEFGKIQSYDGNYDKYLEQKQLETDTKWSEYEAYTAEKKRLQKAIVSKKEKAKSILRKPKNLSSSDMKDISLQGSRKVEDKARGMEKGAKNIQKRLEHMDKKEKPQEAARIRPDFRLTNPPENKIVISGEHIDFSYKKDNNIFTDASFQIINKTRAAVVGHNGAGKTTLIHLIRDRIQTYVVPKAKIGFFEQNMGNLNLDKTVLENIMDVSIQKEDIARMILSRLLLSERDINKPVKVLSGGERIKLAFAKLFVSDINVLVLDEPINFLDIPSVQALEGLFSEYEGTMVFVSHDEAFIKKVATDILVVDNGKITRFAGTPEEYFEKGE